MDDRNDYRSQQYDDNHRMSQHEQWDDRSYRGGNFSQDQDDRVRWRGGNRERSYNRSGNEGQSREFDMADRDRVRIQDDYQGKRGSGMHRSYGSNNYGPQQDRGYGRFTSESYGGRDFADSARAPYYGYAGGTGGPGRGGAYPSPYDYDSGRHGYDRDDYRGSHDRGFFERAGDEIASWFGDDDAARRREMDHRGNGPQGYQRSDERILEDVCDRLTEDRYLDAREITVSVQDGEVTLSGTVPMKRAKRRAEDCADHVSGVGHVQNNLRVQARSDDNLRSQERSDTL